MKITKLYFYREPVVAAYMEQKFGMRFLDYAFVDHPEPVDFEFDYESILWNGHPEQKFTISPDSVHLLEPIAGDVVMDDATIFEIGPDGIPEHFNRHGPLRILARKGVPFMRPESE